MIQFLVIGGDDERTLGDGAEGESESSESESESESEDEGMGLIEEGDLPEDQIEDNEE